jgi:hypothetical protein
LGSSVVSIPQVHPMSLLTMILCCFFLLILVILDIDRNSFSQNKSIIFYKNLTEFILIKND